MTLLRRCLEKHAPKRLPHIGVARLELEAPAPASGAASMPSAIAPLKSGRGGVLAWAGMATALAAGITGGMWWASRTAPAVPASIYRSTLLIPSEQSLIGNAPSNRFALSPDGTHLAYVGMNGQTRQLWLRALDGTTAQTITGTRGASSPFWSPDSRYVAFFAEGKLLKVDRAGGPAETIGQSRFFAENVRAPGHRQRDHRRRAEHPWRGTPAHLGAGRNARTADHAGPGRARDRARQFGPSGGRRGRQPIWREDRHSFAHFLPDGRHFLYVAYKGLAPVATYVATLDRPGERVRLMEGGSNLQVAQDALVFMRGTALVMQPFDPQPGRCPVSRSRSRMPPRRIGPSRSAGRSRCPRLARSPTRASTLESGIGLSRGHKLVWRTRAGAEQVVIDEPSDYRGLAVAPDGRRAVVSQIGDQAGGANLWIVDLARSVRRRLPSAQRTGRRRPPDGLGVVFAAEKEGRIELDRKSTDGTETESEVLSDERPKASQSVSRDGRILLFETGDDIGSLPLDRAAKPAPFVATAIEERYAQFSPDGRWVAYTSDESGRMELYVRAFPGGEGLVQVSPNGGDLPRWSADGKELFFFNDGKIVAASVGSPWRPVRRHVGHAALRLPAPRRVPPDVLRRRARRPVPDDHPRFGAGAHAVDLAGQLA